MLLFQQTEAQTVFASKQTSPVPKHTKTNEYTIGRWSPRISVKFYTLRNQRFFLQTVYIYSVAYFLSQSMDRW